MVGPQLMSECHLSAHLVQSGGQTIPVRMETAPGQKHLRAPQAVFPLTQKCDPKCHRPMAQPRTPMPGLSGHSQGQLPQRVHSLWQGQCPHAPRPHLGLMVFPETVAQLQLQFPVCTDTRAGRGVFLTKLAPRWAAREMVPAHASERECSPEENVLCRFLKFCIINALAPSRLVLML